MQRLTVFPPAIFVLTIKTKKVIFAKKNKRYEYLGTYLENCRYHRMVRLVRNRIRGLVVSPIVNDAIAVTAITPYSVATTLFIVA